MSLFDFTKYISVASSTLGLITLSNLIFINSAGAFSVTFQNGDFEQSIGGGTQNSWNTIGDVTDSGTVDIVEPISGNQAVLTTGYIPGDYASPIFNRNDDNSLNLNQSGVLPVSADTNPNADLLQDYLGLNTDAFSIDRSAGSILSDPRTSKEGSGMFQEFDVTLDLDESSFTVEFDWAFLSNDGSTTLGGDQDFAFWSLGRVDGANYTTAFSGTGNPGDEITVLRSSSGAIGTPDGSNNYIYDYDYPGADNPNSTNTDNTRYSYTVTGLTPGQTYTYRLGYGVVDVDGLDRTSTLLIDNIEVIPFEFSPTTGLFFVASIVGLIRLRRKLQLN